MGLVTDIKWTCPECGKENISQVYGDWNDPPEGWPNTAVPIEQVGNLKYNEPCEGCGKTKMAIPKQVIELPIVYV